jgi:hypothetical protein
MKELLFKPSFCILTCLLLVLLVFVQHVCHELRFAVIFIHLGDTIATLLTVIFFLQLNHHLILHYNLHKIRVPVYFLIFSYIICLLASFQLVPSNEAVKDPVFFAINFAFGTIGTLGLLAGYIFTGYFMRAGCKYDTDIRLTGLFYCVLRPLGFPLYFVLSDPSLHYILLPFLTLTEVTPLFFVIRIYRKINRIQESPTHTITAPASRS